MAFSLDTSPIMQTRSILDYMRQNQNDNIARKSAESSIAMNDEKLRQAKVEKAVKYLGMATPENWSQIRSAAIQEGLGTEQTLPTVYDPNWIQKTRQSFGEKSDMGFKVVGNQIVQLNDQTGEVKPVYTAPSNNPINPDTGLPERKLSATEQKELFDTVDLVDASKNVNTTLSQALGILKDSPKGAEPYTGFGAEMRTAAARLPLVGDIVADKERAASTKEYSTLVTEQALNNLKAIFGGMPTEGERKILLDMQALSTFTPQEQEAIINNAIAAADRRMQFNQKKADAITTGNYSGMAAKAAGRPTLNTKIGNPPQSGGIKFLGFE